MSGPVPASYGNVTPYVEYDQTRQRAWASYVMIVGRAQVEYLSGQFPDRPSYEAAERSAWLTYHALTRGAFQRYIAAISPRPAAPSLSPDYDTNRTPIYDSLTESGPYPAQPTLTKHPGGTE